MDASPLSRLAPELRNRIYELVLPQAGPITIVKRVPKSIKPGPLKIKNLDGLGICPHPLALTMTCKQVHSETARLFYACNAFIIFTGIPNRKLLKQDPATAAETALGPLRRFKAMIGLDNAGALHDVTFDLGIVVDLGRGVKTSSRFDAVQPALHGMHDLAKANPAWNLKAKYAVVAWAQVLEKIMVEELDCIVHFNKPDRSLQEIAQGFEQRADALPAHPWAAAEMRKVVALMEGWACSLREYGHTYGLGTNKIQYQ